MENKVHHNYTMFKCFMYRFGAVIVLLGEYIKALKNNVLLQN